MTVLIDYCQICLPSGGPCSHAISMENWSMLSLGVPMFPLMCNLDLGLLTDEGSRNEHLKEFM